MLSKYNKKKIAKSVIKDFKKNMDINAFVAERI